MNNSSLYDEKTFYRGFIQDLLSCQKEAIIESPFITSSRMKMLYPTFEKLIKRGVKVSVVTRDQVITLNHTKNNQKMKYGDLKDLLFKSFFV